ncbi:hypothetical protein [Luteibacter sp. E-22]|uniref:hypothetical protein n=1 Tax=Luteibacter sp. E-22 TaxID=3404050 RepID=UPI003CEA84E2
MSFNYAGTAATATRLLKRFGAAAELIRADGPPVYDPEQGTTVPSETTVQTTAAVFDFDQKYIDGTLILQGDKQAFCAPGQRVVQGNKLNYKDDTGSMRRAEVVAVKPVAPAGTPVLYVAQLRG